MFIDYTFFIEVSVPSQESEVVMDLCVKGINISSFYDFDIWFWNLSDSVPYFIFHFSRRRQSVISNVWMKFWGFIINTE